MPNETPRNCQNCGHPILKPIISDYCTNCGKLTGVPKDELPMYIPKPDDVLFNVTTLRGSSYKFFSDSFLISKGSKQLEDISYSRLQDCEAIFHGPGLYGGAYFTIKITLKENPPRQIELAYNPVNAKLGSDLITWLNVKLAENESQQPKVGTKKNQELQPKS